MPDTSDVPSDIEVIKQRKKDGIEIPLHKDVQARTASTYLEYVKLVHNALPELDYDDIDLSTTFLGHRFSVPLIIDSMTGGTDEATIINGRLGELAQQYGFGMGLGSQRAGLKSEELAATYSVARDNAPGAFLIANIGGAQLAKGLTIEEARKIVKMIGANALVVHLNPLQELVQPEGEPRYRGVLDRISELVKNMDVPVIVKEVGAGISREVAIRLEMAGVSAINVAGAGGTSWAGVEKLRADMMKNKAKARLGEVFWDWGIPTAASLIQVRRAVKLPLIASGGMRNGLEVAKCVVLGASMAAMAYPFLKAAAHSKEALFAFTDSVIAELKSTMFLVGASNVQSLARSRYMLTGALAEEVGRA
ncbi:type 2 isopentenyl-diphosphate Delta-isomerase [Nitrososphaera sp.]|uniref:type 2 isopentenyl-diphosphate Delta-isomerase n=1 Tax=Nitrososphaera sp. TaxID=1971748 RepID=UPI002ED9B0A1